MSDEPAEQEQTEEPTTEKPANFSLDVPARMLEAVGVAATKNGKFCIDGVYVETRDESGLVSSAATDGRRMVVAEWDRKLFDDVVRLIIPGDIARSAIKLAEKRASDTEPMAIIHGRGWKRSLTVFTSTGDVVFNWREIEQAFPPYRDIIPTWTDSPAIGAIGISPELVAGTLKTLQNIVGTEPKVIVYLPTEANRPLGFQSQDGLAIKALGLVMPVKIDGWIEQEIKGDEKTEAEPELMTPPTAPSDPVRWEDKTLADLGITGKLAENLHAANLGTLGKLVEYQKTEAHFDAINGVGKAASEKIEQKILDYFKANPREPAEQLEEATA